ncbi:MAG TPA: MetS family NSS transporter small subunit [Longimicrobiales bacterium]|nr:MetS family NSS transporter small subunit [Longimicrobiales bacterium]
MEPAAILTFLLISGFIWGGLVVILVTAVRKERRKEATE